MILSLYIKSLVKTVFFFFFFEKCVQESVAALKTFKVQAVEEVCHGVNLNVAYAAVYFGGWGFMKPFYIKALSEVLETMCDPHL